ncbi:hypothetical protein ACFYYB_33785 [Streptomyces sp. NPDC002886]
MTNIVSGGTLNGPLLQGRDFAGLTFNTAPPSAPGAAGRSGANTTQ